MERLGIYGGTFDPPHLAHLFLARCALEQLTLQRVLWVLTPNPPHKTRQQVTALPHRLAMLQLALEDQPGFFISRIDIDRPAPHYAVDTVNLLRSAYPGTMLVYLMGADSLRDLPHWHDPDAFIANLDALGVLQRPDVQFDQEALLSEFPELAEKLRWINCPTQKISATKLRAFARKEKDLKPYLPSKVLDYINQNQLYR